MSEPKKVEALGSSRLAQPDPQHVWDLSRSLFSHLSSSFLPYSPSTLRDLPRPKPSDLPSHLDSSIFTFEDAFEDLLAVSRGESLPDIRFKYDQRILLDKMFPRGEPAVFWMQRLSSQGLIQQGPLDILPFVQKADHTILDRANLEDLEQKASYILNMVKEMSAGAWSTETSQQPPHATLFPHSLEDLDNPSNSLFAHGHRTWENFINTITKSSVAQPADQDPGEDPNWNQVSETKDCESIGSANVVSTTDEYVDRFGLLHRKKVDRTLNSAGKELSKATHWSITSHDVGQESMESSDPGSAVRPPLGSTSHGNQDETIVSQEEYVDRFGFLHKKMKVRSKDENGKENLSTHWVIRSATNFGNIAPPQRSDRGEEAIEEDKIKKAG